jgi:hypothetical protein
LQRWLNQGDRFCGCPGENQAKYRHAHLAKSSTLGDTVAQFGPEFMAEGRGSHSQRDRDGL